MKLFLRRLFICWTGWCPARPYADTWGCGGECIHCGRIFGYTFRWQLRAYADRVVPPR